MKKRIIIAAAATLGVVLLAVLTLYAVLTHEPSIQGKKLSLVLAEGTDRSPAVRDAAHEMLRQNHSAVVPHLLKMMREEDSPRRAQISALMGVNYDPAHARRLTAVRGFQALGESGADAIPELLDCLRDAEVRMSASQALASMGAKGVPPLTEALSHPDTSVRSSAALALGLIGAKAEPAVPALVKLTSDEEPLARQNAAEALGRIGRQPELAVPALIKALAEENAAVQAAAAGAVGEFGQHAKEAIPWLEKLSRHRDEELRDTVKGSLDRINGELAENRTDKPNPAP